MASGGEKKQKKNRNVREYNTLLTPMFILVCEDGGLNNIIR